MCQKKIEIYYANKYERLIEGIRKGCALNKKDTMRKLISIQGENLSPTSLSEAKVREMKRKLSTVKVCFIERNGDLDRLKRRVEISSSCAIFKSILNEK